MARRGDEPVDRPFVRPFGLTAGRTQPSRSDLELTTQVAATGGTRRPAGQVFLSPEMQTILDLATAPIAIAEIASPMALPVTTIMVLVSDLVDSGRLRTGGMDCPARLDFLERVRKGLERVL